MDCDKESKVQRTNWIQRNFFSKLIHVFEPPLPDGVPERLKQIVASANIEKGDVILDVGSGTGILIPIIRAYKPECIYACDLSDEMLKKLRKNYAYVKTIVADVRDLSLPDESIKVVFLNACYPNIADKKGCFKNIRRMLQPGGRIVISHPMGKKFIDLLKARSPFPLDDFPEKSEAENLLKSFGFFITRFVDQPNLYILAAEKKHA